MTGMPQPDPRPADLHSPAGRGAALRVAVAVVAVAVQAWGLYSPEMPGQDALPGLFPDLEIPGADKIAHAGSFLLVTWALVRAAVPPLSPAPVARRRLAVAGALVALTVVHAPLSEAVQGALLDRRDADPADLVADLAGIGLGLAAVAGERRLRTRHRRTARAERSTVDA
jgi:hypothetical protein